MSKVTVTHRLIDLTGQPVRIAGLISPGRFDGQRWYPVWAVTLDGQQITPRRVMSGADGTWSTDLPPNSQIQTEDTTYRYLPDGGEPVYFTVPDAGPVALRAALARPIPTPDKVVTP